MVVPNIQDRSPLGTAGISRTADVGRVLGDFVVFSLCFTRLAPNVPATVKWPRRLHGNFFPRRDQNELILVRRLGANVIGLIANSDPCPPWEGMLVVIHHLFPRAAVDHRVVPFYARPFLPFVGGQGDRAKLNPLDGLIGFRWHFLNMNPIKTKRFKSTHQFLFLKGTGDTPAPQNRILFHGIWHRLVADNVRNGNPPPPA